MDIIKLTIIFSVLMIILNFVYFSVLFFDMFIRIPFISTDPIYVPPFFRQFIDGTNSFILDNFNPLLLLFVIFYIIFYIIYLIIKLIIPDTGFPTFFIPLKELLLQIPPLPALEEYGVFRLFECIVNSFGVKPALEGFIKFNLCFIDFSRDNIRYILKQIFGDIDIDLGDDKPKDEKTIKKEKKKEENIVYRNIDKEVNLCYKKNRIPYKIGMTQSEIYNIKNLNNNEYIKCRSKSIGKYIRII